MQFRNSNIDGEGTSPRGSQKATPQVNNASVITADEDVLHEAPAHGTTLESPLPYETVLHNWKKETVNYEPELECQNWKKKAVNYGPYHEQEREYNKTFESPRDETALNNQKHEHEHTEVQLEQDLIDDLQSILEVLAEHNTQNKNELTGIKELLETVTKAQGNLAGRLDQIESESAKKNLSREFRDQASGSEVSWGEEPEFLDNDTHEVRKNYLKAQRTKDHITTKLEWPLPKKNNDCKEAKGIEQEADDTVTLHLDGLGYYDIRAQFNEGKRLRRKISGTLLEGPINVNPLDKIDKKRDRNRNIQAAGSIAKTGTFKNIKASIRQKAKVITTALDMTLNDYMESKMTMEQVVHGDTTGRQKI